jgi:hypothetical protein
MVDLGCPQLARHVSSYLTVTTAGSAFVQVGAQLDRASWVKWHRFFRIKRYPVLISATLVVLVEV